MSGSESPANRPQQGPLTLGRLTLLLFVSALVLFGALVWPDAAGRTRIVAADNTVTIELSDVNTTAGITFEPTGLVLSPAFCATNVAPLDRCSETLTIQNTGDVPFTYQITAWIETDGIDEGAPGLEDDDDEVSQCFFILLTQDLTPGQTVPGVGSQGPFEGLPVAVDATQFWRIDIILNDTNDCQGVAEKLMVYVRASGIVPNTPTPGPATETPVPPPTEVPPTEVPATAIPATAVPATSVPVATTAPLATTEPLPTTAPAATAAPAPTTAPQPTTAPAQPTTVPVVPAPTEVVPPAVVAPQQQATPVPATGTSQPTATAQATSTAAPTSTAVPGTTPTVVPTPTPTPTPTAIPAVVDDVRPTFVEEVLSISDISLDPVDVATNLLLALALLMLILLDATVFNAIVKENSDDLHAGIMTVAAPVFAVGSTLNKHLPHASDQQQLFHALRWVGILLISAFIYGFLEEDFGFNTASLVFYIGLVVALALTTLIFDGGQVLVAERWLGLQSTVRLFPVAVLIAIASVMIARFTSIQPGVVYGFVAAATITGRVRPTIKQDGLVVYVPMLILLFAALIAWVMLPFFQGGSQDGSALAAIGESVAAAIFVGGVQTILFSLLPIEFVDGLKVWRWSKWAWLSMALPTAFLLFHVILNSSGEFDSALQSTSIRSMVATCIVAWVVTGAVWLYFRVKNGKPVTT